MLFHAFNGENCHLSPYSNAPIKLMFFYGPYKGAGSILRVFPPDQIPHIPWTSCSFHAYCTTAPKLKSSHHPAKSINISSSLTHRLLHQSPQIPFSLSTPPRIKSRRSASLAPSNIVPGPKGVAYERSYSDARGGTPSRP